MTLLYIAFNTSRKGFLCMCNFVVVDPYLCYMQNVGQSVKDSVYYVLMKTIDSKAVSCDTHYYMWMA